MDDFVIIKEGETIRRLYYNENRKNEEIEKICHEPDNYDIICRKGIIISPIQHEKIFSSFCQPIIHHFSFTLPHYLFDIFTDKVELPILFRKIDGCCLIGPKREPFLSLSRDDPLNETLDIYPFFYRSRSFDLIKNEWIFDWYIR